MCYESRVLWNTVISLVRHALAQYTGASAFARTPGFPLASGARMPRDRHGVESALEAWHLPSPHYLFVNLAPSCFSSLNPTTSGRRKRTTLMWLTLPLVLFLLCFTVMCSTFIWATSKEVTKTSSSKVLNSRHENQQSCSLNKWWKAFYFLKKHTYLFT